MMDDLSNIRAQYERRQSAPSGRTVAYVVTNDSESILLQGALVAQLKERARRSDWRRNLTIGQGWTALLNAAVPNDADDELLAGAMRLRLDDLRALRRGELGGTDVHALAIVVLDEIAGLSVAESASLLVADCLRSADAAMGPMFDPTFPIVMDATDVQWVRTRQGAGLWRLTTRALRAMLNQRGDEERFGRWTQDPDPGPE